MNDPLVQDLVARGWVNDAQLEEILIRHRDRGGSLDTAILESGAIDEARLLECLAEVSGVPAIQLSDFEPNLDVAALLPPKIAERLGTVPLSLEGIKLHIACTYPVQENDLREIGFLLNKKLELWIALEVRVRDWISILYKKRLSDRFVSALNLIDPVRAKLDRNAFGVSPAALPEVRAPTRATQQSLREPFVSSDLAARPLISASASPPVAWNEGMTLEEALSKEAVEELAKNVALEPIPLQVKKAVPRKKELVPSPEGAFHSAPTIYERFNGSAGAQQIPTNEIYTPRTKTDPGPFDKPSPVNGVPDSQQLQGSVEAPIPAPRVESPPMEQVPPQTAVDSGAAGGRTDETAVSGQEAEKETRSSVAPEQPSQWTLAQARTALGGVTLDRDGIIDVALRYGTQAFDFIAAFAVVRGSALGWAARGENSEGFAAAKTPIPLDSASLFRTVMMTRGSHVGPIPADSLTRHFLKLFGRSPRSVFLFPVVVKSRVAAILYGDRGQKPISQRRLSDYLLFCQELPAAFERLILFKKQRFGMDQATALQSEEGWNLAASAAWSPLVPEAQAGRGRAATLELSSTSQAERPPPDFDPLLKRLIGPDAAGRSRAFADFARSPEASARFLAANFPGPTAWSRVPVAELPQPEELGPVPGALARLGRPGAIALAPLLDAADLDARYLAILTAGSLPFPELVDGVLRALFDVEPDVSSAARATAAALRSLSRFDASLKDLRQELAARDPLRRSLAARALGVLHDREAIDGLIGLTGSDDQMCAEAAAGALREITKASFGTRPRQWSAWWAENRTRRRVEWLIAGLHHKELDLRLAAIEELSRCINDNLGYFADAPEREREAAIARWLSALDSERLKRLE